MVQGISLRSFNHASPLFGIQSCEKEQAMLSIASTKHKDCLLQIRCTGKTFVKAFSHYTDHPSA